ncbi:type IX secretion system protein PorQ [Draconibacterium sp. IB214405]|uniref:type IX secretion system protein PorQ n=1 Tax=Draconibacterium sp. IB214405 TaxID=3097352 RepID=UPI002A0FB9BC|nr:type IX secretion system protein PorQ [Draconibacterium sp. IB214405]MDX8338327.1 type IX secretion system protein PorQ [Draconibacterium sp. IB214405]
MKRKLYVLILFSLLFLTGKAQIGGEYTYQFLELTNSARIAALGGTQIAIYDSSDLNLPYANPALLHAEMDNRVLVNYVNYLADVNYGYASYAKTYDGIGNFAVGMHYINYGQFEEATETGELTGATFNAAEYALNLIYSNSYKRLNYGVNLKPILSSFETYQSFGIAADLGASFASKNGYTNVALVVRNFGTQISTYYDGADRERIPLNIQAGISKRLQHAPLIFSATMQHLNHWDLASSDEEEEFNGETIHQREESFAKQTMRHLVLGAEILPSENFTLRVGYNYQRRQELKFDDKASTVGFSAGFGLKIKRFHFDYAISRFHLAGSSNLFSVSVNLNNNF